MRHFAGEIPFAKDGSLLAYADSWDIKNGATMRKAEPFTTTLEVTGFARGRSAATFTLVDGTTGASYPMSAHEVCDMLRKADVIGAKVTGKFGIKKQGANYSLFYMGKA